MIRSFFAVSFSKPALESKRAANANSERISTHCVDSKLKSKKREESIIPGPIIPNLPGNHEDMRSPDMSTLMLNSFYPVKKTPETSKHKAKLYTPSTLNIDFIQWHTQLNVCAVK